MKNDCLNIPLNSLLYKSILNKIILTKMYHIGADLGIGQKIGLAFYKVITFFQTKYKNQHEFIILEGKNKERDSIYLLTELCSLGSGNYKEISKFGYFLYYSHSMESLIEFTEQKNPKIIKEYSINLKGDLVMKYVEEQTEEYKSIGNNCQDYAFRFLQFCLENGKDNFKEINKSLQMSSSRGKLNKDKLKEYKSSEDYSTFRVNFDGKMKKEINLKERTIEDENEKMNYYSQMTNKTMTFDKFKLKTKKTRLVKISKKLNFNFSELDSQRFEENVVTKIIEKRTNFKQNLKNNMNICHIQSDDELILEPAKRNNLNFKEMKISESWENTYNLKNPYINVKQIKQKIHFKRNSSKLLGILTKEPLELIKPDSNKIHLMSEVLPDQHNKKVRNIKFIPKIENKFLLPDIELKSKLKLKKTIAKVK